MPPSAGFPQAGLQALHTNDDESQIGLIQVGASDSHGIRRTARRPRASRPCDSSRDTSPGRGASSPPGPRTHTRRRYRCCIRQLRRRAQRVAAPAHHPADLPPPPTGAHHRPPRGWTRRCSTRSRSPGPLRLSVRLAIRRVARPSGSGLGPAADRGRRPLPAAATSIAARRSFSAGNSRPARPQVLPPAAPQSPPEPPDPPVAHRCFRWPVRRVTNHRYKQLLEVRQRNSHSVRGKLPAPRTRNATSSCPRDPSRREHPRRIRIQQPSAVRARCADRPPHTAGDHRPPGRRVALRQPRQVRRQRRSSQRRRGPFLLGSPNCRSYSAHTRIGLFSWHAC